ncbi:MAG: ATP-binding cassette domain-containing protein [Candidatus Gracilibacteria bacterium]
MINYTGVSKKIGNKLILDDIDLEIEGEEFVFVIGPSGAGKSTLLHLLIGADTITSGEIYVDNYRLSKAKEKDLAFLRRRIGMVFQDYKLLATKTVFENVAFALEVCGNNPQYTRARTNEVLKLIGIFDIRNSFPGELSGGEKQKVALARAMANNPPVLIADEPTGNLDPDATDELIKLFEKMNKMGTTVIIATHNEKIVNTLKKRVIQIDNGKITRDKKAASYRA